MINILPTMESKESYRRRLVLTMIQVVWLVGMIIFISGQNAYAGSGATVVGQVIYRGAVPAPQTVEVVRDADFCGTTVSISNLVVDTSSKGVQGVVVNIEGLDNPSDQIFASPPPELRNQKCAFSPRIVTAMSKTRLHITNDDPLMHNTHIHQGARTFVNVAQVPGGRTFKKRLKRPGVLQVKCDKHEFMKASILVFDHPYHSVTDTTGHFQIAGVPPGSQELTIWHEVLGTIHAKVEVPKDGEVVVAVEYPKK